VFLKPKTTKPAPYQEASLSHQQQITWSVTAMNSITSSKKYRNNNSTAGQRQRLINAVKDRGQRGLTTIYARERLDCMHAAGRIEELRKLGWNIATVWTTTVNAQGNKHRNARYVLMSTQKKKVAA